jgi:hypothetical protein
MKMRLLLLLWWAAFLICAVGTLLGFHGFLIIPTVIIPVIIYIYAGAYMIDAKSEIKSPVIKFLFWLFSPLVTPCILIAFDRLDQVQQGVVQTENTGKLPDFISDSSGNHQIAKNTAKTETGGFGFSFSLILCLWNIYAATCNAFSINSGGDINVFGFHTSLSIPDNWSLLWFIVNEAIGIWCCYGTAKEYEEDLAKCVLFYLVCPPLFFYRIYTKSKAVFPVIAFVVSLPLTVFYYIAFFYVVFICMWRLYFTMG